MIVTIKGMTGTVLTMEAGTSEVWDWHCCVEKTVHFYDVTIMDTVGTEITFRGVKPQEIQRVDG